MLRIDPWKIAPIPILKRNNRKIPRLEMNSCYKFLIIKKTNKSCEKINFFNSTTESPLMGLKEKIGDKPLTTKNINGKTNRLLLNEFPDENCSENLNKQQTLENYLKNGDLNELLLTILRNRKPLNIYSHTKDFSKYRRSSKGNFFLPKLPIGNKIFYKGNQCLKNYMNTKRKSSLEYIGKKFIFKEDIIHNKRNHNELSNSLTSTNEPSNNKTLIDKHEGPENKESNIIKKPNTLSRILYHKMIKNAKINSNFNFKLRTQKKIEIIIPNTKRYNENNITDDILCN